MAEFILAILLLLAPVAAGEAPSSLVGEDGYTLVVCSMYNRLNAGATMGQVAQAYFARPRKPTKRELEISASIASGNTECPPVRYVMGEGDRLRHQWQPGDWQGTAKLNRKTGGILYQVHGYQYWPKRE